MSAVEIHHELCMIYGQNLTSKATGSQWYRMFKHGQADVDNKERSGQLAICSE
jgi:hypothetical protein